jgi:hypothetical protein
MVIERSTNIMKPNVKIFYNNQSAELDKINNIINLAEVKTDITMEHATPIMVKSGVETPIVEINSSLYAYPDAVAMLREIS